jgi:hypothetical protein
MRRGSYRPVSLLAAALASLLCLVLPVRADPRADRASAASAHAGAAPAQLDYFATKGTWFTTEFDTSDFNVERFEASLPSVIAAPAGRASSATMLAAAQSNERKPPPKPAADHPRNKTPAAKQPLHQGTTRGKTHDTPARISVPVGWGVVAAAPPATTPRMRPHAARPDRGPRELIIARVAPSDRDEAMPAQPLTPVTRAKLAPPALALK